MNSRREKNVIMDSEHRRLLLRNGKCISDRNVQNVLSPSSVVCLELLCSVKIYITSKTNARSHESHAKRWENFPKIRTAVN